MNNPIVCGNWNSGPAMRSFVGFESNSEKHQFSWDWETNNPLIIGTTNTEINHGLPCLHQQNSGEFSYSTLPSPLLYSQIPVGLTGSSSDYGGGVVKREGFGGQDGRIGLNLGHRTYFSSQDSSSMINRLFRRSRGFLQPVPRCQAEDCRVDLTNAKHYHRRHKVCEFHSKATKVITGGLEQRFCQQCSRFHVLAEFDEEKRSCRKRLADHNRRRRKPQPGVEASSGKSVKNVGGSSHVSSVLRSEMKPMSPSPSLPLMRNCSNQVQQHKEPPHQQCLQKDPALSPGGIEFETQSFSSSSREIAMDLSPWISLIRFSKSSGSDFP